MNEKNTRAEWLEKRRTLLTASDVAAVLGVDPRRGPLAVYADKVLEAEDEEGADYLAFGREAEGAIAGLYARRTGRPVKDLGATVITPHPELPWIGATLDRVTEGTEEHPVPGTGPGPLELKNVGLHGARPDAWAADPPLHYQIQLQVQIACLGAKWGCLAGMFPGYGLGWRDWPRNEQFMSAALPVLEEFWARVQRRSPPPPDTLPGTQAAVKRLYPRESGTTIILDAGLREIADQWEAAKKAERDAKKTKRECEAQIRAEIKDATFGDLGDGTLISCKTVSRKEHVVKASASRQLRRFTPKGD